MQVRADCITRTEASHRSISVRIMNATALELLSICSGRPSCRGMHLLPIHTVFVTTPVTCDPSSPSTSCTSSQHYVFYAKYSLHQFTWPREANLLITHGVKNISNKHHDHPHSPMKSGRCTFVGEVVRPHTSVYHVISCRIMTCAGIVTVI